MIRDTHCGIDKCDLLFGKTSADATDAGLDHCPKEEKRTLTFDAGDLPDGTLVFTAKAIDFAGNKTGDELQVSFDRTDPAAPKNIVIKGKSENSVEISWDRVLDDGSGIEGYQVKFKVTGHPPGRWQNTDTPRITIGNMPAGYNVEFLLKTLDHATNDSSANKGSGAPVATVATVGNIAGLLPPQYNQLNGEEKDFCVKHSIFLCIKFLDDAKKAQRFAEKLFSGSEVHSDLTMTNSFKHSFWTALMEKTVDSTPFQSDGTGLGFAVAHEHHVYDSSDYWDKTSSRMDLHNNRVGFAYADSHASGNDSTMCHGLLAKARHALLADRAYFNMPGPYSSYAYFQDALLYLRMVDEQQVKVDVAKNASCSGA